MVIREIKDWKDFRNLIDSHHPSSDLGFIDVLYRGQVNEKWNLCPSLLRKLRDGVSEIEALGVEFSIYSWFKARADIYLSPNISSTIHPTHLAGWWSIMQHYGAPTRLLDWTESPYVAAYFAVNDLSEWDAAVWIADTNTIGLHIEKKYQMDYYDIPSRIDSRELYTDEDRPFDVIFIDRTKKFERLIAQQGYFSICRNVLGIHDEIIDKMSVDLGRPLLTKLIIPASLKLEFLKELKVLNITGSTLFPGLDGLGRSVTEMVKIDQLTKANPEASPNTE